MSKIFEYVPSAYNISKIYVPIPNTAAADFSFTRNSVATRINENGLIEEMAENVPRIDYSGGGCLVLFLEDSAENLIEYSDDISQWDANNGSSVSLSSVYSPSGTQDVYKIQFSTQLNSRVEERIFSVPNGDYVFSFYAKADTVKTIRAKNQFQSQSSNYNDINLTTEWQRFEIIGTQTIDGVSAFPQFVSQDGVADSFYVWGAQFEQGSVATSYIPTNGTPVTRAAETNVKTGDISDIIDSTKGVFEVDLSLFSNKNNKYIEISDNDNLYRLGIIFVNENDNLITIQTKVNGNAYSFGANMNPFVMSNIKVSFTEASLGLKINSVLVKNYKDFEGFGENKFSKISYSQSNGSNPFRGTSKGVAIKPIESFDSTLKTLSEVKSALTPNYTIHE